MIAIRRTSSWSCASRCASSFSRSSVGLRHDGVVHTVGAVVRPEPGAADLVVVDAGLIYDHRVGRHRRVVHAHRIHRPRRIGDRGASRQADDRTRCDLAGAVVAARVIVRYRHRSVVGRIARVAVGRRAIGAEASGGRVHGAVARYTGRVPAVHVGVADGAVPASRGGAAPAIVVRGAAEAAEGMSAEAVGAGPGGRRVVEARRHERRQHHRKNLGVCHCAFSLLLVLAVLALLGGFGAAKAIFFAFAAFSAAKASAAITGSSFQFDSSTWWRSCNGSPRNTARILRGSLSSAPIQICMKSWSLAIATISVVVPPTTFDWPM